MATPKHMPSLRVFAPRLELVAATIELARAEMSDFPAFARLLDVLVPEIWPPPLNDENSQRHFLASMEKAAPNDAGWNLWFCILREPRILLGNIGFKGVPVDGVVEIGYSLLEAHHQKGYCTEAARALIDWAFRSPRVNSLTALTLPELLPSIRVMEKCGLIFTGDGPIEDGMKTVRYELTRERYAQLYQREQK
jgi:ribosomal-protein-alanine N-acetyltransferase